MAATRDLAAFIAGATFQQLPSEIVRQTKRAVLNYLAVAIGASRHQAVRILTEAVLEEGGHPQASIIGSTIRVSALQAARVNGAMSHVFDFDDTDLETIVHPTGPVLSPALALAQWRGLSGRQVLAAEAIGAEVELRVATAVYPAHYDIGWHITGTAGAFGSAAASSWLLGLDTERTTHALGLAATQAAGLREMFGSMAKSLHVGEAAYHGLWSALLAEKGFTASTQALEAKRGFCAVLAGDYDLARATDGLGEDYMLFRNGLKPYACGVVTHPTIDGVRRLRERHLLKPEDVAGIDLQVHPLVLELTGKTEPRTGLEGKFSIYFCAAIALMEGNAGQSQFTDSKVNSPEVVALRSLVQAVAAPGVKEGQAMVTIRTVDGRVLTEWVEAASGTPENPLSDEDLVRKYLDLVLPILHRDKAEHLMEAVWRMEDLDTVDGLFALATP